MNKKEKNTAFLNLFLLRSDRICIFLIFFQICYFLLEGITSSESLESKENISFCIWCTVLVIQICILKIVEILAEFHPNSDNFFSTLLFVIYLIIIPLSSGLMFSSTMSWIKIIYYLYALSLSTAVSLNRMCLLCVLSFTVGIITIYLTSSDWVFFNCLTLLLLTYQAIVILIHISIYAFAKQLRHIKDKPLRAFDHMDSYFKDLERRAILIRNQLIYYDRTMMSVDIVGNFLLEEEIERGIQQISKNSRRKLSPKASTDFSIMDHEKYGEREYSDISLGPNKTSRGTDNSLIRSLGYSLKKKTKSEDSEPCDLNKEDHVESSKEKKKKRTKSDKEKHSKETSKTTSAGSKFTKGEKKKKNKNKRKKKVIIDEYINAENQTILLNEPAVKILNKDNWIPWVDNSNNAMIPSDIEQVNKSSFVDPHKMKFMNKHFSLLHHGSTRNSRKINILKIGKINQVNYVYFDKFGIIKRSTIIPLYVFERYNITGISDYLQYNVSKKLDIYFKYYNIMHTGPSLEDDEDENLQVLQIDYSSREPNELPNKKKSFCRSCCRCKYHSEFQNKKFPKETVLAPQVLNNLYTLPLAPFRNQYYNTEEFELTSNVQFTVSQEMDRRQFTNKGSVNPDYNRLYILNTKRGRGTMERKRPLLCDLNEFLMNGRAQRGKDAENHIRKNLNNTRLFYMINSNNENTGTQRSCVYQIENTGNKNSKNTNSGNPFTLFLTNKNSEYQFAKNYTKADSYEAPSQHSEKSSDASSSEVSVYSQCVFYVDDISDESESLDLVTENSEMGSLEGYISETHNKIKETDVEESSRVKEFLTYKNLHFMNKSSKLDTHRKKKEIMCKRNNCKCCCCVRCKNSYKKKSPFDLSMEEYERQRNMDRELELEIEDTDEDNDKYDLEQISEENPTDEEKEKYNFQTSNTEEEISRSNYMNPLNSSNPHFQNDFKENHYINIGVSSDKEQKNHPAKCNILKNKKNKTNSKCLSVYSKHSPLDSSSIKKKRKTKMPCLNKYASTISSKLSFKKKKSREKENLSIFTDLNFNTFYDFISPNFHSKPYNYEVCKKKFHCKQYVFSHIIRKKWIDNVKQFYKTKTRLWKNYWKHYNHTFFKAQWENRTCENEHEYRSILKYSHFNKWYSYWIKLIMFNYYKNCFLINLALLILNVVTIFLQTWFFSFILMKYNAWNLEPLDKNSPFNVTNECVFFCTFIQHKKFIYIRSGSQLLMNILFILPSGIIKNYEKTYQLTICGILNVLTNILFGVIDIVYSISSKTYNIQILYNYSKNKNIFDLFLSGKLITSIFLIPFLVNFHYKISVFLLLLSCFSYILTYNCFILPYHIVIRLTSISNYILLFVITFFAMHFSRVLEKSRKILFVKYVLPYFVYITFLNTDSSIQEDLKQVNNISS